VTQTSETQNQTEQLEAATPGKRSKSILALSLLAIAINGAAAIYTMPPSFKDALPNVGSLAALLPHERASAPTPDPVVAALKDIQSAQQQHAASLQENGSSLQQNTALLQQHSTTLVALRQSVTDEQVDIKAISSQLSKLMAKVDSLENAIAPEITSSIPKGKARNRLSAVPHKRWARPAGPVSVGGAPLTTAPAAATPQGSPEG
jgi:TolA-binding protein